MGEPLFFKKASEPTNIIWENRENSKSKKRFNTLKVLSLVFLILFLSFWMVFELKKQAIENNKKYRAVNCMEIKEHYKGETYERYTWIEYNGYYNSK